MKRLSGLILLSALTACTPSAPEHADPVGKSVEANSVAVSELSQSAEAPAQQIKTIPTAFIGVWDALPKPCTSPSDMRMTVEADSLSFWETGGQVTAVSVATPSDITVQANMSGEGEEWQRSLHMVLSADGNTLTIDEGKGGVRVRCPA